MGPDPQLPTIHGKLKIIHIKTRHVYTGGHQARNLWGPHGVRADEIGKRWRDARKRAEGCYGDLTGGSTRYGPERDGDGESQR